MGIRIIKPTTPGNRFSTRSDFEHITTSEPEKKLTKALRKSGGRNNNGRITVRHRGGGHRRRYRIIDFKRDKTDITAKVATIEYDPNRSANIALLHYVDGEKRYVLAPFGLKIGDQLVSSSSAELKIGNALCLKNIPTGLIVHNIEMHPGKGAQLVRSAGTGAQIMAHDDSGFTTIKLPSGEVRLINSSCYAVVGEVGNRSHEQIVSGKAGRSRWLGRRPKVRGVAMNPVDHPMGGGEGKHSGGLPRNKNGVPAKGFKTRDKKKASNKYIIERRKKK